MKFPTKDGRVSINSQSPGVIDQYQNGVRLDAVNVALFTTLSTTGAVYSNGLPLGPSGAVVSVVCTDSLPAGVVWCNGIPVSDGAVCISKASPSVWENGIAFTEFGAISVVDIGEV